MSSFRSDHGVASASAVSGAAAGAVAGEATGAVAGLTTGAAAGTVAGAGGEAAGAATGVIGEITGGAAVGCLSCSLNDNGFKEANDKHSQYIRSQQPNLTRGCHCTTI